ncbi:hypothetical protein HQN90_29985 [Paenibacillus alba]|uniref:hypothetical protein n=1 Tax=Paenibacillus alba TaxID=1197127 RepID=UPI001567B713|nr:hypothetical protein [Paenibacillus alba]NQX70377.1 hypothetical protein [Paenibacillus alba]
MKTFESAMMDLFLEVFKAYVERKDEKILIPGQRVVRGTSVSNSAAQELPHTHVYKIRIL